MELTTSKYVPELTYINCEESTAVDQAYYSFGTISDEIVISVTYTTGRTYTYIVPTKPFVAGLGMESVGQFVNTVVKRNAVTFVERITA